MILLYKNKSEIHHCSNYRGIKLLRQRFGRGGGALRLRKIVNTFENQFIFMPRISTTKVVHTVRSLVVQYRRKKKKDLHMVFMTYKKLTTKSPRRFFRDS